MSHTTLAVLTACALGAALDARAAPADPSAAPARPPRSTTVPQPRPDLPLYQASHEARLHEAAKGGWDIVLLGDSIVGGWNPQRRAAWQAHRVLNLGCAGDRTENLLWRLAHGEVAGLNPALVILLIGTNNTGHFRDPPDRIAAGVRAILDELRARLPGARIVLLGLLPRGLTADDAGRLNNRSTNALIRSFADNQTVFFVDASDGFLLPDGALSAGYRDDHVHLNDAGYAVLMEAVGPLVARLMSTPGAGAAPDPGAGPRLP